MYNINILEIKEQNSNLAILVKENIKKDLWSIFENEFLKNNLHIKILSTSQTNLGYIIYALKANSVEELNKVLEIYNSKLDHKQLGSNMELFINHPYSEEGVMCWLEDGIKVINNMEKCIKNVIKNDYKEIACSNLLDKKMFEKTGHLDKFAQNILEINNTKNILRPMACPQHMLYFNNQIRTYKELPFRIYETNTSWRNEASGAVNGLLRSRVFRQDDGHILCTKNQVISEIQKFIENLETIYKKLEFTEYRFYLATRPIDFIGDSKIWDQAENLLRDSVKEISEIKNEGAFYGPKIEVHLKDGLDRWWQCGTIQLDMFLAEKMDLYYLDENNQKQQPIVLHRAIYGSFERMLGIMLESNNGLLPDYITPYHVILVNLNENKVAKIKSIAKNIRILDCNTSINDAIKIFYQKRIPRLWIAGNREDENTITITYNKKSHNHKQTKKITIEKAVNEVEKLINEVAVFD